MVKADARRTLRTFAVGAACGFIGGAALVAILITRYAQPGGTPAATTHSVSTADGLADVDSPVLEERRHPAPGPTATSGSKPGPTIGAGAPDDLTKRRFEMPV